MVRQNKKIKSKRQSLRVKKTSKKKFPYLHGFSPKEQKRLREQARFGEFIIFSDINYSSIENLLEVGCGVGAQTEILLRRFPDLKITGIDLNTKQLGAAHKYLSKLPYGKGRFNLQWMDASNMEFKGKHFDGAFLCWILEHVPNPSQILSETRRVLRPGGRIYITEVMNHSFFLEPYSPSVWKYWMALNDYQHSQAGDPFIGAKLGNLLSATGFKNVETHIKTFYYDHRHPENRKEVIDYWTELLLSAKDVLLKNGRTTEQEVAQMVEDLTQIRKDPNAVFMYTFMQATATA